MVRISTGPGVSAFNKETEHPEQLNPWSHTTGAVPSASGSRASATWAIELVLSLINAVNFADIYIFLYVEVIWQEKECIPNLPVRVSEAEASGYTKKARTRFRSCFYTFHVFVSSCYKSTSCVWVLPQKRGGHAS